MKKITSLHSICGALLMSIASMACGGGVESAAYASTDNAGQAVAKAAITTRGHGPMRAVGEALGEVSLTASQRTEIEQLFKDADARHAKAKADSITPRKTMLLTLATEVESGNVDRAAMKPQIDAMEAPWASARTADRTALERINTILGPAQRAALVGATQGKHPHGVGHDKEGKEYGHHNHDGRMAKWGAELQLTPAQQQKIREDLRADHTGDGAPARVGRDHAGRMIHLAEVATPILTPAQRALAAAKLRDRADHVGDKN